jgi:hypothetical protein
MRWGRPYLYATVMLRRDCLSGNDYKESPMLRNASAVNGYAIVASDGHLGAVSDFLFDDTTWLIRWLVVKTGDWLSGRKVLLPAFALGHLNPERREFSVRLTKQQVKESPDIDTERPVSRQMETHIYDYYGWSPYWGTGLYTGGYTYGSGGGGILPMPWPASSRDGQDSAALDRSRDDPHLRSTESITGYHIHAIDGQIGHVEDFLIEDGDWSIHYLTVDTKNWWPGKRVLISPRSVQEINWTDGMVNLHVDRKKVRDSPEYDASMSIDRAYETRFHNYYGDLRRGNQPREPI